MGLVLVWTPLYGRDHLHLMPGPANLIQDGNWSLGSVLGQTSNASQLSATVARSDLFNLKFCYYQVLKIAMTMTSYT